MAIRSTGKKPFILPIIESEATHIMSDIGANEPSYTTKDLRFELVGKSYIKNMFMERHQAMFPDRSRIKLILASKKLRSS